MSNIRSQVRGMSGRWLPLVFALVGVNGVAAVVEQFPERAAFSVNIPALNFWYGLRAHGDDLTIKRWSLPIQKGFAVFGKTRGLFVCYRGGILGVHEIKSHHVFRMSPITKNPKFLFKVSVYKRGCPFRLVAVGSNVL